LEWFGRYVAIVMVIGLLTLFVVGHNGEALKKIQMIYIKETVNDFLEKVAEEKLISFSEWEVFQRSVNRYGLLCDVELTSAVKRELVLDESETSVDWFKLIYHSEIVKELYQNGKYKPMQGAYVTVKVSGKNAGLIKVYFEQARKID